jgi:hypothetical protein
MPVSQSFLRRKGKGPFCLRFCPEFMIVDGELGGDEKSLKF